MNDLPSYSGGFTVVGGVRETPLESVREIWRFRPLIAELVLRDLKVRYKNRIGGVLWSLATPLMQVLTITLMVKFLLSSGVSNYSAYLMPVMFLWQFFQNCVLDASNSMTQNAQLARKIYFPRGILPIVTLITNLIHFSVSFGFTLLYFFTVPVGAPIFPQNLGWQLLLVIPFVAGVCVLALGVGYLLAYLNTLYEDVRFLTITTMGLFLYVLPILYPIERVAMRPDVYGIYMLNPMAAWMVGFQRAFLPSNPPAGAPMVQMPWAFLGIAAISSLVILAVGFTIFERSKWTMMERL
ncbi:MAG TPA: ABC transporter permease [Abditibacterium sp.]|jgi:ABC-type polysaccharide/polyol phosphate export permease